MEDKHILLIILAVVLVYFLMSKNEYMDTTDVAKMPEMTPPFIVDSPTSNAASINAATFPAPTAPALPTPSSTGPEPNAAPNMFAGISDGMTLDVNMMDPALAKYAKQAPDARPKLTASDLLPGYSQDTWFDNPDVGIKVEDANLMADALSKIGVDTVGTTQKNPSYDLRGTIPCPKFSIGPFNNSTVEPDINLKTFY
jgi:hypothetical protein